MVQKQNKNTPEDANITEYDLRRVITGNGEALNNIIGFMSI